MAMAMAASANASVRHIAVSTTNGHALHVRPAAPREAACRVSQAHTLANDWGTQVAYFARLSGRGSFSASRKRD